MSNYNNGSVTLALTANGSVADRLEIRSTGTNDGQISLSGDAVSFGTNIIGTFTGGLRLTPLVVSLNTNATLPAVQQLLRSITFGTITNGASLATRLATVILDDGRGATAGAAKAIRVGTLRQTQYQEGGDYGYGQYFGAADIALSEVGHATPWPAGRTPAPQEGLLIDWPDGGTPNESQVLLRFDNFVGTNYWQVPSNAIVVSAELLLQVNNTGDGGTFHRMLMPWDATNATWDSFGYGVQLDDVQASSQYDSQLGVEDGSGATGTGIVSVGVTPDVQAWVNGDTNYGWVIKGWPLQTDGTGFSPSEVPTVGERPRLLVKWLPPGYVAASFRQGANDYAGTHDTNLRQATPDVAYGTDETLWSDAADAANGYTNATEFLLRFDDIVGTGTNQIPPGAQVLAAILDLASVANNSMGDGGQFYAMLQPWDDTNATWNSFGPDGIQPDGIEAATTPTVVAGNSSLNPNVQGTVNSYEVTADVQAWVSGRRPNYGWVVLPWPGGTDGWGSRSSKYYSYVDPNDPTREHPRLRVYYTASMTPMAAVLKPLVVSPTQVRIEFTGTPGTNYRVLRSASLNGPFTEIGSGTPYSNGNASYNDNAPLPGTAFYRVLTP